MPRPLARAVSRGLAAALTAALLTVGTPTADARCATTPRGPALLSPDAPVPAGGGVLVETHAGLADAAASPHAYALVVGGLAGAPEALAPGLVVYRVPAGATSATLTDGPGTVRTVTVSGAKARALPAPKLKAITDYTKISDDPRGLDSRTRTTVLLAGVPPAGAVALIAYDSRGTARTYALVGAGAKTMVVYDHGRCDQHPPGMTGLRAGEKATVAWVDAAGIVGARSKPTVVRATTRT